MERALNQTRLNPVTHGAVQTSQTDFAVDVGGTAIAQQSVIVPEGYSSCVVVNGVSAAAVNSTGSSGVLYVSSSVNGAGGAETPATVPTGGLGSASAVTILTLTDLVFGATITVEALVRTGSGTWAANAANFGHTSALFLFQR